MTIFDVAAEAPWAMLPERLEQLLAIASRQHETPPEALEAYRAAHIKDSQRASRRDDTGILYVDGPLFKRANLFVELSGATSYEILRRDLQVLMDDPTIRSVMFMIDSPGGEANGCDELAAAIYGFRGQKPMTAYVSGQACSAAYWIASSADKIVVSDAAVLGSIGVVLGVTDTSGADERRGVRKVEFVSSQSPGKRPDIATDAGRARIQKMVDDMANVFVSAVARNRKVSAEDVITKFGGGGVEIGAKAVALGMADRVGSIEAEFAALKPKSIPYNRNFGGLTVTENTPAPAADAGTISMAEVERRVSEATARAFAEANTRMLAITSHAKAASQPDLVKALCADASISAAQATALLDAVCEPQAAAPAVVATPEAYAAQKRESGALGLPEPAGAASADRGKSGWDKARAPHLKSA